MSYCQSRKSRDNLQQMVMGSRVEIEEFPWGTKHPAGSSSGGSLPGFDVFVNCFIEKTTLFSDLAKYKSHSSY